MICTRSGMEFCHHYPELQRWGDTCWHTCRWSRMMHHMRRQYEPGTFHDRLDGQVILESAQQFGGEWYPMLPWLWCRWAESWTISDQASWTEWIFSYCSIAWHNLGVWERIEIPKQHRRHRHHTTPCKQTHRRCNGGGIFLLPWCRCFLTSPLRGWGVGSCCMLRSWLVMVEKH